MKKRIVFGITIVVLVTTFILSFANQKVYSKHQHFSVLKIGTEVIRVYRNGKDFTETYKNLEHKAKEAAVKYLNKEISEVLFFNYCMLEMEGMTLEVTVKNMHYTFLFDIDGNILKVSCSENII